MLEDKGKKKTHSCSAVGKGQSKAVVSLRAWHTSSCQPSESGAVFLCPAPTRLEPARSAAQRLLESSTAAGLEGELWVVAVVLYF